MNYTKLDSLSKNITNKNVELIQGLFPSVVTEQDGKKVIDFEKLKMEFSEDIADDTKEKYQLTWPGKRKAIIEANKRTDKTLVPLVEKSVDFENTKNIYIEGDNLEVLKILQESYSNKIKCIYIDPPYNTGKDFIYKDNFKSSTEEELLESGQIDEEGNRFTANLESNGRYHSDWLSMMYPRLKLARNLLKEDGVIFISIDDNEYDNLKKICDEIFGENNFVSCFIWQKTYSPKNNNKYVSADHEYVLCYAKNLQSIDKFLRLPRTEKANAFYNKDDGDGKGPYGLDNLTIGGQKGYDIKWNGLTFREAPTRGWAFSESKMYELIKEGRIYLPEDESKRPRYKRYLSEVDGIISKTILSYDEVGHTDSSKKYLNALVGNNVFDYPKPVELVKRLIRLILNDEDNICLDFFSGSATTAESLFSLNNEIGGKNKFILVQLPEEISNKDKAAQEFCDSNKLESTIPSIAQERIKRAGAKIKEETNADIDYGFRVFKLTDSILSKNAILSSELTQTRLLDSKSKYVEDSNKLDILSHIILDMGLKLDVDIKVLSNYNYVIEEGLMFISLSNEFTNEVINEIIKYKPDKVVLDENSFKDDAELNNATEELKNKLPNIDISII